VAGKLQQIALAGPVSPKSFGAKVLSVAKTSSITPWAVGPAGFR
jgi:hypothetical protein